MSNRPGNILISEFNYELPQELIPAYPLQNREDSKLLVYNDENINQSEFKQIGDFLPKNTLLIFNNTKVISARLKFNNSSQQTIEIFLLGPTEANYTEPGMAMQAKASVNWSCLVGNLKRWKEETLVYYQNNIELKAKIIARRQTDIEIQFNWQPATLSFAEVIDVVGQIPIPPYLERDTEASDNERYQTVYAKNKGSVAAPTAGLHFTKTILNQLQQKGVKTLALTLHVGAGTFKPVKSPTLEGHDMHAEWLDISFETIEILKDSIKESIIAVGTTSLRALESIYWMGLKAYYSPESSIHALEIKQWEVYDLMPKAIGVTQSTNALAEWMRRNNTTRLTCRTQILIAPPYKLMLAKGLITNFHQPQSTLLLIIAAVTGNNWRKIYQYAILHKFRFLSYGDSSLLMA